MAGARQSIWIDKQVYGRLPHIRVDSQGLRAMLVYPVEAIARILLSYKPASGSPRSSPGLRYRLKSRIFVCSPTEVRAQNFPITPFSGNDGTLENTGVQIEF